MDFDFLHVFHYLKIFLDKIVEQNADFYFQP